MPFRYQSVGAYKSSVVEEVYSCFLNYLPFIQSFFAAAGFSPYSEATFITILDTFFHGLEYQLQIINWKNFQNVKVQNGFFYYLLWAVLLWWCRCLFPSVEQLHQLNEKRFQTTLERPLSSLYPKGANCKGEG